MGGVGEFHGNRAHQHGTNLARTTGDLPNYTNLRQKAPDHAIGRSRGGSAGGRPPAFDAVDYKGRSVVERNFATFKQWRGIATRCDKLVLTYRGGAVLRAITIWANALGDTP